MKTNLTSKFLLAGLITLSLVSAKAQTYVSVTVQPNPSGRSFTVDGISYTNAQPFSWVSGDSHTIATTSPQSGGSGIQYVWSNWSDNGTISHTVNPTISTIYTANFITQYYLSMDAGYGGSVIMGTSGFYNSGTNVTIKARPISGYSFVKWSGSGTGSYLGSNNPALVTMNSPISENALFVVTPIFGNPQIYPQPFGNSQLGITLSGVSSGETIVFQVSTDLKNWTSFQTNVMNGSTFLFSYLINPATKGQYIRAVLQ